MAAVTDGVPKNSVHNHLSRLSLAKYRFTLSATTKIILPVNKGSALHGGFGHALKLISPHYYRQLCEPCPPDEKPGKSWPLPYILLPPLDPNREYRPGDELSCELTLFGTAADSFSICYAALEYLGSQLGFGNNRGKFVITGVGLARPPDQADNTPSPDNHHPVNGQAIAQARKPATISSLTLHFPTRLRLKAEGRLVRQTPPFALFFARLLGRLNTLALCYGQGSLTSPEQKLQLLQQADNIQVQKNNIRWDDWSRFSGRQQSWMKFGGLLGSITYRGDLKPFLPYLALGEWTHAGGKTSFGLGKYVITHENG